MNSIPQQAVPKGSGHSAFLRPQLMNVSALLVSTDVLRSCSTSIEDVSILGVDVVISFAIMSRSKFLPVSRFWGIHAQLLV
jgi:hypothetical protein